MATLSASLKLNDQFTAVLNKIDSGIQKTAKQMENMKQKVAGPAQVFQTLGQKAQAAVNQMNSKIQSGMSRITNKVQSSVERIITLFGNFGNRIAKTLKLDAAFNKLSSGFSNVTSKISSAVSSVGGVLSGLKDKVSSAFSSATNFVKSATSKIGGFLKQSGSAFKQYGNEMKNGLSQMGNALAPIGQKLGNTLKYGAIAGTAALVGLGKKVYDVAGGFEQQMSRVKAISGATGEAFEKLKSQAIDLGAQTAFSAVESAAGMENLASAGFNAQEIMAAMPGLLDLAAVSGGDVALASENTATALRGFGLEASQAGHVANVFARAAADTNAEVADMGEAMKYIAPVANSMGISMEETAAAIGIMSDAGIKGSQAGTTLRGALSRLAKPTDPMIDKMKALGLSFYDANGQMKPLTDQVGMLKNAFKGLTPEQQQNALVTLYGQESLSGMMALIEKGPDALGKLTNSLKNSSNAAKEMAEEMQNNLPAKIEQLGGAFESVFIRIGQAAFPSLGPAIEDFTEYIDKTFSEEKIGSFFTNLSKYGTVLKDAFNEIKGPVSEALGAVKNSLIELNGSFGSDQSVEGFKSFVTGITDAIKGVASFVEEHSDSIAKLITMLPKIALAFAAFKIGKGVVGTLTQFGGGLLTATTASGNLVKNLLKIGKKKIPNVPSSPTSTIPDSSGPINNTGNAAGGAAKKMLSFGAAVIMAGAGIALAAVGFKLLADAAISLADSGGAAIAVFFGMIAALAILVAVFAYFGTALTAGAVGMLAFGATMLLIGAALAIAAPGLAVLPPVIIAVGIAFATAAVAVGAAVAMIIGAVAGLVSAVASGISQVVSTIGTVLVDVLAQVGETLAQVTTAVSEGISGIIESVSTGITSVIDSIGNAISGVLDSVAGIFDSIGQAALDAGTGLQRMADAIGQLVDMNVVDLGVTLGKVASSISKIAKHDEGMVAVGSGMSQLASSAMTAGQGILILAVALPLLGAGMAGINANATAFGISMLQISTSASTAAPPMLMLAATALSASLTLVGAIAGVTMFSMSLLLMISGLTATTAALMMFNVGTTMVVTTVTSGMSQISASAVAGMSMFRVAVLSGMTMSVASVRSGVSQMTAAVSAMRGQMFSAGLFAMSGLASGIQAGASSAIAAARSVANQVTSTIQSALKIHSPSRVMIAVGGFVTQGLAKGILAAKSLVTGASQVIANAAVPSQLASVSSGGTFTSNVELDDSEISRLQASASQTVVVQNKQVTPQVHVEVHNDSGEPVDVDEIVGRVEEVIIDAINSDLE